MTISDEELDELKHLLERATTEGAGPLIVSEDDGTFNLLFKWRGGPWEVIARFEVKADADLCLALFNLAPRLLSHYRSARNDGIEEAAKVAYGVRDGELSLRNNCEPRTVDRQIHDNGFETAHAIYLAIRALVKSPPQSEPGTEDRGKER